MPIWVVDPWRSMNDAAAASAASRRLGGMSVAHMLRETSIARITVVWPAGTLTMLTGRAIATMRLPEGEDEQGERQMAPDARRPGQRVADERQARVAQAGAAAAQDPDTDRDERRQQAEEHEERGRQQAHGRRPSHRSEAMPPTRRTRTPAPAKSEVTSIASGRTTRRVSMLS